MADRRHMLALKLEGIGNTDSPPGSEDYRLAAHNGESMDCSHGKPQGGQSQPPKEFVCPISLDLMAHPVTLVQTGQNFDRASLERWFHTGAQTCPLTGVHLSSRQDGVGSEHTLLRLQMRPNATLQQSIVEWTATGTKRKAVSMPSLSTAPEKPTVPPLALQRTGPPSPGHVDEFSARGSGKSLLLWRLVTCFAPLSPGRPQAPSQRS